jgi:SAM-dependent methyltransferase
VSLRLSYHERIFASVANSASGDVGAATRFHYRQEGGTVWATYRGGAVRLGTLIARVLPDDSLDVRYQHVTTGGELKAGRCLSRPEVLADGRIRLHERWQWTEGGSDAGESIVEEVGHAADRLSTEFGQIDIYLFDQLLRGRIVPGMRILDAGCGAGRNLVYFLRSGYDVFGVDADRAAIEQARELAAALAPHLPAGNFRAEPVEAMAFEAHADVVISSAVLHFARDDRQFEGMLSASWRALKPGGLFFCRLASSIGIEPRIRWIEGRRGVLPDGSTRYVVDEPLLLELGDRLGGTLLDPLKTTIVQDRRSMATWVLRKASASWQASSDARPTFS